ncbi:MAG: hypothetical protein WEE89_14940 [Gemmatimonadota bacterium]
MRRFTLVAVSLALLASCDAGTTSDKASYSARDSAGIEIVESRTPIWDDHTRWRLGEQPTLEIGAGIAGDSVREFGYISGVHSLSGGTVAVVDAWAPSVMFFDAAGGLLGRIGRRGTGPGEFPPRRESVRNSFVCGGDTVFVVVSRSIAAYVSPGAHIRTMAPRPWARTRTCAGNRLIGELWHTRTHTSPGIYRDSLLLAWYDLDGKQQAVIDSLPAEERAWSRGTAHEGMGYSLQLFGRVLSLAGRDGVFATGFGETFQVELRDAKGITRIMRVAGRERNVSAADVQRFRDYVFNPWRGNDDERRNLENRLASAIGGPRPAFAELRFDQAGNLWVREYDHTDAVAFYDYSTFSPNSARPTLTEVRRWVVLDMNGRYLGEVTMPRTFDVHEIGEDWVLGVWRDELDIQYVRKYPLIKSKRLK